MIHFNNLIQLLNRLNNTHHSSLCGDLNVLDTNTRCFTVKIFNLKHSKLAFNRIHLDRFFLKI